MIFGGAKEPGMMYFPTKGGAKEPQNPQNHRVAILHLDQVRLLFSTEAWGHGACTIGRRMWCFVILYMRFLEIV